MDTCENITSENRFFYVAKPSVRERETGLGGEREKVNDGRDTPIDNPFQRGETERLNIHPTVKPFALIERLVRLVKMPKPGTILDPFCGSGSVGMAVNYSGLDFIGIEIDPKYAEIARKRIQGDAPLFNEVDQ